MPPHTPAPGQQEISHTKGPWTVSRCPCGHPVCQDYFVSVTKSDGRVSQADARLIAAAPDLLDALENIAIGIGLGWDLDGLLDTARTAIHKATGTAA